MALRFFSGGDRALAAPSAARGDGPANVILGGVVRLGVLLAAMSGRATHRGRLGLRALSPGLEVVHGLALVALAGIVGVGQHPLRDRASSEAESKCETQGKGEHRGSKRDLDDLMGDVELLQES